MDTDQMPALIPTLAKRVAELTEQLELVRAETIEECAREVRGYFMCINGTEYHADDRLRALLPAVIVTEPDRYEQAAMGVHSWGD